MSMNKYQFSFLFLFIPFFVFGQNFTKIIDFSITENLDSLGFKPQYIDQGEPYVPIAINCINDEIVILDSFN
ncbi:MAG: hypothetical protein PF447_01865, partial [Spirochaetaceae bacterium]|nr:hypothetical protein [Spirochaetaceae bacterium]